MSLNFKAKMHKFDFGWGSGRPPQASLGELTVLPQTSSCI